MTVLIDPQASGNLQPLVDSGGGMGCIGQGGHFERIFNAICPPSFRIFFGIMVKKVENNKVLLEWQNQ